MVSKSLKEYRKRLLEVTKESDFFKRVKESIKKSVPTVKINFQPVIFESIRIQKEVWKSKTVLVARSITNGRFESWQFFDKKKSMFEQRGILKSRVFEVLSKNKLRKLRKLIPDDGIALKVKKRGRVFETYMVCNIVIFIMYPGMSPVVKYKTPPDMRFADRTQTFYPYQDFVSMIKNDVLSDTGLSLEEWVLLSKTTNKVRIVGGFTWKLFDMSSKYENPKFITKRTVNFDKI